MPTLKEIVAVVGRAEERTTTDFLLAYAIISYQMQLKTKLPVKDMHDLYALSKIVIGGGQGYRIISGPALIRGGKPAGKRNLVANKVTAFIREEFGCDEETARSRLGSLTLEQVEKFKAKAKNAYIELALKVATNVIAKLEGGDITAITFSTDTAEASEAKRNMDFGRVYDVVFASGKVPAEVIELAGNKGSFIKNIGEHMIAPRIAESRAAGVLAATSAAASSGAAGGGGGGSAEAIAGVREKASPAATLRATA